VSPSEVEGSVAAASEAQKRIWRSALEKLELGIEFEEKQGLVFCGRECDDWRHQNQLEEARV